MSIKQSTCIYFSTCEFKDNDWVCVPIRVDNELVRMQSLLVLEKGTCSVVVPSIV